MSPRRGPFLPSVHAKSLWVAHVLRLSAMMACFGPLMLPPRPPPNNRVNAAPASPQHHHPHAGNNNKLARRRSSSTCRPPLPPALPPALSSTYLSFDDEVEFEEIIPKSPPVSFYETHPQNRGFSVLHRSHSEGNLRNLGTGLPVQRTFNKYIRALSGSWKNLLQGLNKPEKIERPRPLPGSLTPLPPRNPTLNLNSLLFNSPPATGKRIYISKLILKYLKNYN